MKCFFCDRTVDKHPLFRINPKGQKGIWACREHASQADAKIDPEVREIVDLISPPR